MRTRENINDSLGIYLNQIAQIPLLTESEEKELARSGNIEKLIEANLRLVVHWALSYTPNATQSTLDLIQEGNIGLVKAAHRYTQIKGTNSLLMPHGEFARLFRSLLMIILIF